MLVGLLPNNPFNSFLEVSRYLRKIEKKKKNNIPGTQIPVGPVTSELQRSTKGVGLVFTD